MTIGERIALKRREQGLSQEALGETLGVTRQSISKWEGDITLPEIDKLIALSRLFGVSVGWLLGEERRESASAPPEPEDAPSEPEAPPPPEELSEEQMKLVEEIVGRYIAAQPRPLSTRQRQRLKLAAALAALCFAAGMFRLSEQIKQVKEDNQSLRQAISDVAYSVNSQVAGVTGRVEEALKDQANLFASYNAAKSTVDLRGGTVTFRVSALPKSYEAGMSVAFLADNGRDTVKAVGSPAGGGMFEAPLICALTDDISVYAVLCRIDGSEERQLLAQFHELYSATVPAFGLRDSGRELWDGVLADGTLTVPEQIVAAAPGSTAGSAAGVKAVQLGLFKNQHLVEWCEPVEAPEEYGENREDLLFFRMRERSVVFGPGDAACYALVVTDEYDRVTVRYGDLYSYESFRDKDKGPMPVQEAVPAEWYKYAAMEDWSLTREFLERSPGHRF